MGNQNSGSGGSSNSGSNGNEPNQEFQKESQQNSNQKNEDRDASNNQSSKKSELQEQGVSNNQTLRTVSNRLDKIMSWDGDRKENSSTRAVIHAAYHQGVGYSKQLANNQKGADAEFARAKEQWNTERKGNKFSPGRKQDQKKENNE